MTKYNNGIGSYNGVCMSLALDDSVFVRKVNPLMALGSWQAFFQGLNAYGETKEEAIASVKAQSEPCFETDYID